MKLPLVTEAKVPGHCGFHWPQFEYFREHQLQKETQTVLDGTDESHPNCDYGSVKTQAGMKDFYRSLDGLSLREATEKIIEAGDPYARRQWYRTLHGELCYERVCCK